LIFSKVFFASRSFGSEENSICKVYLAHLTSTSLVAR
jgi:hypothetical protein